MQDAKTPNCIICGARMVSRHEIIELLDQKGFDALDVMLSPHLSCPKEWRNHPYACMECYGYHQNFQFCEHDWSVVEHEFEAQCPKCKHLLTNSGNLGDWLYDNEN